MTSNANEVRYVPIEDALKMTISERIEAAFRLGDEDLASYMATHQVTREEALRQIRNARQAERPRPSRCKSGD